MKREKIIQLILLTAGVITFGYYALEEIYQWGFLISGQGRLCCIAAVLCEVGFMHMNDSMDRAELLLLSTMMLVSLHLPFLAGRTGIMVSAVLVLLLPYLLTAGSMIRKKIFQMKGKEKI